MEIRIIKSPSPGTLAILAQRAGGNLQKEFIQSGAVGLVQGKLIEMIVAADIAEKTVGVTVVDIKGNCPQHMILLAIFGDTASVETAIAEIRKGIMMRRKECSLQN